MIGVVVGGATPMHGLFIRYMASSGFGLTAHLLASVRVGTSFPRSRLCCSGSCGCALASSVVQFDDHGVGSALGCVPSDAGGNLQALCALSSRPIVWSRQISNVAYSSFVCSLQGTAWHVEGSIENHIVGVSNALRDFGKLGCINA